MSKILSLNEFKKVLDRELFKFLAQEKAKAKKIDQKCALLVKEIIRLNRAGGKRLRPYICYLGFCLLSKKGSTFRNKALVSACLAVELLESLALIHDDIMDEAKLRRGQPTCYQKHGRDLAILAGDLIFSPMDDLMSKTNILAQKMMNQLKFEIVCGQFLDTVAGKLTPGVGESRLKVERKTPGVSLAERDILKIYKYKTAMYTVLRPLQIGYLASGNNKPKDLALLKKYGENIGIAFQIIDDVLDLYAKPKFGKVQGGDIKEGKLTFFLVKLLKKIKGKDLLRLKKCLNNKDLSLKEINWVKDMVEKTKTKQECEDYAYNLMKKSQQAIMSFSGNKKAKQALFDLAEFIVKRDY